MKCVFLCLLKHYNNRVSAIVCVFVVEREKQKMIIGISGFGNVCSKKRSFRDGSLFSKKWLLKPHFTVFFGVSVFSFFSCSFCVFLLFFGGVV